jgi:hypothetical protein
LRVLLAGRRTGWLRFVSTDTRLLAAAQWLGLATDNPDENP